MKFVLYHRVSTSRQGLDGYGMSAQAESMSRYLGSIPNAEVVQSFSEVESGANNDRPQLKAAIALCKQTKAKLLCSKLDRLSRSCAFLMQLQESSIDFAIAEMPAADRFTISILACVSQHERTMISQRTKAGLAIAKARGVALGNPRLAEARINAGRAVQAQKQAFAESAIKAIREVQSAGVASYSKIAECLTKRGERTSRGKTVWTATGVRRVIEAMKNNALIWKK